MRSEWIWIWCGIVALASLAGGLLPSLVRWTHRRLQMALSFVSGVMLGVALFHMLPHAVMAKANGAGIDHHDLDPVMLAAAAGFLAMFFVERFASFHHHEPPGASCEHGHDHSHDHGHAHGGERGHSHDHAAPVGRLTWLGAALGLTLHGLLEGVALASSVIAANTLHPGVALAGFGTFLVILLHKPFDAMTLVTLFSAGGRAGGRVHLLNLLYGLVVPLGAALFIAGVGTADNSTVAVALAFSAGTFLCIAGSDLLPELQFHRHDRFALSLMLAIGVALAWGVGKFESSQHGHESAGASDAHEHAPAIESRAARKLDDHADHDHSPEVPPITETAP
ncbi:MAG: ZIP family metal transporter [Planctomycetota bacterium]